MHPQYPAPDIKHLIDRLHTRHALRLEDLELSGPIEVCPGVTVDAAGAHTEGSMNVHVETAEGRATICGDVIYDFNDQIVNLSRTHHNEPAPPATTANTKREERCDQRPLSGSRFLLPVNDSGQDRERQVWRGDMAVRGPIVHHASRNWFGP